VTIDTDLSLFICALLAAMRMNVVFGISVVGVVSIGLHALLFFCFHICSYSLTIKLYDYGLQYPAIRILIIVAVRFNMTTFLKICRQIHVLAFVTVKKCSNCTSA